jgi:hypothetical protein
VRCEPTPTELLTERMGGAITHPESRWENGISRRSMRRGRQQSVDDANKERIFQRNTLMRVSSAFSMVVILGPSSLYLLSEMCCSRNAASTSFRGDLNSASHNFHHALTAQTDSHRECGGPVLHYALIRSNLDIELSLYVLALMLLAFIRSSTRVAQTK